MVYTHNKVKPPEPDLVPAFEHTNKVVVRFKEERLCRYDQSRQYQLTLVEEGKLPCDDLQRFHNVRELRRAPLIYQIMPKIKHGCIQLQRRKCSGLRENGEDKMGFRVM